MKYPAPDAMSNGAAADAERSELFGRDDAVLPRRYPPDEEIQVHKCRIESLPGDVRQNCMA